MSSAGWLCLPSRMALAGVAALLSVAVVSAQSSSFPETSHSAAVSTTESSSTDFNYVANDADASPAAPAAGGGGQYDNKASGAGWKGKLAFEFGGGFNIPTGETWTYGYDNRNELLWAEDRATDGGTLLQRLDFTYDAWGDRVEKDVTVGGTTTVQRYALDGWKTAQGPLGGSPVYVCTENWDVLADLDGSSSLTTR